MQYLVKLRKATRGSKYRSLTTSTSVITFAANQPTLIFEHDSTNGGPVLKDLDDNRNCIFECELPHDWVTRIEEPKVPVEDVQMEIKNVSESKETLEQKIARIKADAAKSER